MTTPFKLDMKEATRLTREGKLGQAVTLLREALAGVAPGVVQRSTSHASEAARPRTSPFAPVLPFGVNALSSPQSDITTLAPKLSALLPHAGEQRRSADFSTLVGGLRKTISAPFTKREANFGDYTFTNAAGTRDYKLYVPGNYDGRPQPLVVMLHGCTQSPEDFAAGTRMNEMAEKRGFLVAYPAQPQSANMSKCWNWFNSSNQLRDRGEPSLIAGITHQIMRDFQVDTQRIYIAGLSAGGAAAAIMGAIYPDLYAAVGIHSGLACGAARDMQSAFSAMRHGASGIKTIAPSIVPTIVFHGDEDKTVNQINADQIIEQAKAEVRLHQKVIHGVSSDGMNYTRSIQLDAAGRPMLEQWVLHGAGHAWSGGSAAGSYTDPAGPDASQNMVAFFLQQTLADRGV